MDLQFGMNDIADFEIQMDSSLKMAAEEVFEAIGLDAATAVRIFFTKVVTTRSIPFILSAESEFSPEAEERILQAWEESKDPENLIGPFDDM
jgi:addiction module RelB/DinJ family antitoxin